MKVSAGGLAIAIGGVLTVVMVLSSSPAHADATARVDGVVSDVPGFTFVTDPNLINPIGIASSAASPAWVADNGAGSATLYNVNPRQVVPLVVSVPSTGNSLGPAGAPTGDVFNIGAGNGDFAVSGFASNGSARTAASLFMFATNNGTIAGWSPEVNPAGVTPAPVSTHAITAVSSPGSNYTGLAIASNGGANLLYAANFAKGTIDVFNPTFTNMTPAGSFTDPTLPAGFAPFNVQTLNGSLFVTYARTDGSPGGIVDKFGTNGGFVARIATNGPLDAPYGLAIAPASFGALAGALVVGNHGDGTIDFFDPTTGTFLGKLIDPAGGTWTIPGLWALLVGNGNSGGSPSEILFTAGPNEGLDGLFGEISPVVPDSPFTPLNFPFRGAAVPEPASLSLLATGFGILCVARRRRCASRNSAPS